MTVRLTKMRGTFMIDSNPKFSQCKKRRIKRRERRTLKDEKKRRIQST